MHEAIQEGPTLDNSADAGAVSATTAYTLAPLTRRRPNGQTLKRGADIEAQIVAAGTLAPAELLDRARLESGTAGFLKEEALVYFIREAHRNGDANTVNGLAEILIRRSARQIAREASILGPAATVDAYNAVIQGLFQRILEFDDDRGDFFQCRFRLALKRLTISTLRPYFRSMRWEGQHIAEPPSDPDNDEDRLDVSEWVADTSVSPEGWALLKDALKGMPAPARAAFVLHRAYGLPIESNDPSELTVSRYFGKTSRTIRNWLRSAEEHLRTWRGEEK